VIVLLCEQVIKKGFVMKKMAKFLGIIAITALIAFVTGCGGDDGFDPINPGDGRNPVDDYNPGDGNNPSDNHTTYTVTYNAMGAIGIPPTALTVNAGTIITLHDGSGFSRSGHIFNGWYTNIAGTRTDYNVGASYTVTSNVIFYANWAVANTVTFDINNGRGEVPSSQTVITGTSIMLPNGNGLSRTGFTFGGWNINTSGSGTNYDSGSIFTVNNNVTLFARWDANVEGAWSGVHHPTSSASGTNLIINYKHTYSLSLRTDSTFTLSDLFVTSRYMWNIQTNRYDLTETSTTTTTNGIYSVTGNTIRLMSNSGTTLYTGTISGNSISISLGKGTTTLTKQ
jgi:uncharacterized repeat protein (TIGR02543 family)